MDGFPGPSNRGDYAIPFTKRSTTDLMKILPECASYKYVENLNEVFELLDEKLGMMMRVMTTLMCQESTGDLFSRSEVLKKVIKDCHGVSAVVAFQKVKLSAIKTKGTVVMMNATEINKESNLLRNFFSNKRKLPVNPFLPTHPERKKRKPNNHLIGNAYRSICKDMLLYPSPILKLSEFVAIMNKNPASQKFTKDQVDQVILELSKRNLIKGFPCDDGTDYIIVKQLCVRLSHTRLNVFEVTEDDYMTASVPKRLSDLREIVDKFDAAVLKKIDTDLWAIVVNMIIATLARDPIQLISPTDFPEQLPHSVIKVISTLTNVGFLEDSKLEIMFRKRVTRDTVTRLSEVVEIQWCLNRANDDQ